MYLVRPWIPNLYHCFKVNSTKAKSEKYTFMTLECPILLKIESTVIKEFDVCKLQGIIIGKGLNSESMLKRRLSMWQLKTQLFVSLTGVHFRGELQHVADVSEQKIKCWPIRTREIGGVRL